jgi:hypothetical protein
MRKNTVSWCLKGHGNEADFLRRGGEWESINKRNRENVGKLLITRDYG